MRHLKLLGLLLIFTVNLNAQYRSFSIQKSTHPNAQIVEFDFRESSTLVYMKFIGSGNKEQLSVDINTYIIDKKNFRKYKMVNSINLPIGNKKHILEANQNHNYILEFEKLPEEISEFDIIENPVNGANFYGIVIDKTAKESSFMDYQSFISDSPVKEFSFFYKEGNLIMVYNHLGLKVACSASIDKSFGSFYQVNLIIQNTTGNDVTFNPTLITARLYGKGVKDGPRESLFDKRKSNKNDNSRLDAKVLTYAEYMKKVNRRQAWNEFAVGFSQGMAAYNAGHSTSTTNSNASGYVNTRSSASGYIGNSYGSVNGTSSSYITANGTSTTNSYNGAAAYAAQQNAANNVDKYRNNQYEIKRTLSEGYMKINTISNESEYIGFVNIEYSSADILFVNIPINNSTYTFSWDLTKP